jgi:geranylgeranyl diphosphate synthase type I
MTPRTFTLTKYKKDVVNYLTNYLSKEKKVFNNLHLDDKVFVTITDFLSRGKMFRANLLILSSQILAETNKNWNLEKILAFAGALELIQAGLLIHDDIIDQDQQRRGKDSIWQHFAKQKNNNQQYGKSQAICLGDLCFYMANQLILQASNELKQTLKSNKLTNISQLVNQEISQVILAEMQDVQLASSNEIPSLAMILETYLYKTARYSFSLPLMMAAHLTEQKIDLINQLSIIGEKIGLIFQIQDDYLGIFGNNKKVGKPILSDIREGKKTVFYYYLMQSSTLTNQERELITSCFACPTLEQKQILQIQKLFKVHSLKQVNDLLEQYKQEASSLINVLKNEQMQKLLTEILYLAQDRQQ